MLTKLILTGILAMVVCFMIAKATDETEERGEIGVVSGIVGIVGFVLFFANIIMAIIKIWI